MGSAELQPATPPLLSLEPPPASDPSCWDGLQQARQPPPSPRAAGSLGAASDSQGQRRRISLSLNRNSDIFGQSRPAPALWRESTAVSDCAASQGLSFEALCGGSYIAPDDLHRPKPLGEGAFAVVDTAELVWAKSSSSSSNWLASSSSRVRTVAVKRLKPHVLESKDEVLSFIQEARLLVNLRHPSVIEYIGLGAVDHSSPEAEWRTMYLVQEYANCGTLKKLLLTQMINPTKKLFSLEDAVRWSHQVAEGLAYLHQLNPMIIHRDLKAENVLLTRGADGVTHAKLADFGLHKLIRRPGQAALSFYHINEEESVGGSAITSSSSQHGESSVPNTANASSHSLGGGTAGQQPGWQHGALLKLGLAPPAGLARGQAGALAAVRDCKGKKYDMTGQTGALTYMAPEVLLGSKYNEKVDVFSFGVVLYELLHRKMVVADLMYLGSAAEAEAFAFKVAAGYRMPICQELPDSLRRLISDCLAGDCDLRPSMAEVVRRLDEVRQSGELQQHEHRHGPASAAGCCAVM